MFDPRVYEELDAELNKTSKFLKVLTLVEPENIDEERKAFLEGKQNPEFQYSHNLDFDPDVLEQSLHALKIPGDEFGNIFEKKRRDQYLELGIIRARGNSNVVKAATVSMHGLPNAELVQKAKDILKNTQPVEEEKTVSPQVVRDACEAAIRALGITDYVVDVAQKKKDTANRPSDKTLSIGNKLYSQRDVQRLAVHEGEVHVSRTANGYEQPLKIFATGISGYLQTEEGLGIFAEEVTGTTDPETMRKYAARVLVADFAKAHTFRESFEMLKEDGFTEAQSWDYTIRFYRGGDGKTGAYFKDHYYLAGLQQVANYVLSGGDMKTLFAAKISTTDVPMAKRWIDQGILKSAKFLPRFVQEEITA